MVSWNTHPILENCFLALTTIMCKSHQTTSSHLENVQRLIEWIAVWIIQQTLCQTRAMLETVLMTHFFFLNLVDLTLPYRR